MLRAPIWLACIGLLVACRNDTLIGYAPRIELAIYHTGQTYRNYSDKPVFIDLGDVPVFAPNWAIWVVKNPTGRDLFISSVTIDSTNKEQFGEVKWLNPEDITNPLAPFDTLAQNAPISAAEDKLRVPAHGERYLGLRYLPNQECKNDLALEQVPAKAADIVNLAACLHVANISIVSNAVNKKSVTLTIVGNSVFTGRPDIELVYQEWTGPDVALDCNTNGCLIPSDRAIDFGNISLGETGMVRLRVRNMADCPAYNAISECDLCGLMVEKNNSGIGQNIGFGFKPGTNPNGLFEILGSVETPFTIKQRRLNCSHEGEMRWSILFHAPLTPDDFSTTLVIESNAPDESVIELPIKASAKMAPVAIARLVQPPSEDDVEPFTEITLDGSLSYDPLDSQNKNRLVAYIWQVTSYPEDADVALFLPNGQNTDTYRMTLPIAGHYEIKLTVWNVDGLESGDTPSARVNLDAVPRYDLLIQMMWLDPLNDQDLHFVYLNKDERVCNQPWDCHWKNPKPIWFEDAAAGEGPNPLLLRDDNNGLGPETLVIHAPREGHYRIYVHYYGDYNQTDTVPTRDTVQIWFQGELQDEYERLLPTEKSLWAVADIFWSADGQGILMPYPADEGAEDGALAIMPLCQTPGWTFP